MFPQCQTCPLGLLSANAVASCKRCSICAGCWIPPCLAVHRSPSCVADGGCLSAGSDFSVPVTGTCTRWAFSTEHVQVFSGGNIASPCTGSHPPASAGRAETQVLSFLLFSPPKTAHWEAADTKPITVHYSCLCTFIIYKFLSCSLKQVFHLQRYLAEDTNTEAPGLPV